MQIEKSAFRTDINGLRAIAVLAVVFFHFNVKGFSGGFAGVDIFFVISGFLMTGIIFRKTDSGNFNLLGFYLSRAKRIVPALAFLCLSVLLIGWILLLPSEYQELGKHVAASISFLSNHIYLREAGYFDAYSHTKWLLHTWSLSVEWQFYIIFPLIVLTIRKLFSTTITKCLLAILTAASFALCVKLSSSSPDTAFYILPTRAWELLAGGLVFLFPAQIHERYRNFATVVGLCLITASITLFDSTDVWPGWLSLIPVAGTALLIFSANQTSVIINNRIFASLGEASYSIYLWHWPIVVLIGYYGLSDNLNVLTAGIVSSLFLGYLSLHIIETPARKLRLQTSQTAQLAGYALIVLLIGAGATSVFIKQGFESRVSNRVVVADRERKNNNPASKSCFTATGVTSPKCIFGDTSKRVGVIVMGDSHSDSTVSAVVEAAGPDRPTLYLGYLSCLTIPDMKLQNMPSNYQCGDFVARQIAELRSSLPGTPLIITNRTSVYIFGHNEYKDKTSGPLMYFNEPTTLDNAYKEEFRKRYISSMCELSKHRPVYVTKPIPEMTVNVPTTLARNEKKHANAPDITLPLEDYYHRNTFAISVMNEAAERCGIHLLDPVPALCDTKKCYGSINGVPLYMDDNHLSEFGNKKLIPMFETIWN